MKIIHYFWVLLITKCVCGNLAKTPSHEFSTLVRDENYPDDEDYPEEDEIPPNAIPSISSQREDLVVDEMSKVELPCKGEHLKYFAIFWMKGDDLIASNDLTVTADKRFSIASDPSGNSLVINNVSSIDNGEYVCKVQDGNNVKATVVHTLTVNVFPKAWTLPRKVVKANDPATIYCNVTGYPVPSVRWERKDKYHHNNLGYKAKDNMVTFQNISRHHAGIYECIANNTLGTTKASLHLHVMHPPEIHVHQDAITTEISKDVEIHCTVHAEPKAPITFYKDGKVASSKKYTISQKGHQWTLQITSVQDTDFGKYSCMASNSLGKDQKVIELLNAVQASEAENMGKGVLRKDGATGSTTYVAPSIITTIALAKLLLMF